MAKNDRLIGVYHFLFDKNPAHLPVVQPKYRHENRWRRDSKSLISRVRATGDLKQDVLKTLALLGLPAVITRGDKVLIKPNFNSADPYPASTDIPFLQAVVEIFLESGAKITIGESSGGVWRPTSNVFRQLNMHEFAKRWGVELIAFEDRPKDWVDIQIAGDYLRHLSMPRSAYEADKLIYLPCMKTHRLTRYSGALKLAFGFVHPGQRRAFHRGHLEQKIAEVNLCWQPDLIIMDGRKSFITGGPGHGQVVEPGILMASGDQLAIDSEAVKILLSYKGNNRLRENPLKMPQFATAVKHGLGTLTDYVIVE